MAYQGNHYIATFELGGNVERVDVYSKDESDARAKILMLYPSAANIVVASGV